MQSVSLRCTHNYIYLQEDVTFHMQPLYKFWWESQHTRHKMMFVTCDSCVFTVNSVSFMEHLSHPHFLSEINLDVVVQTGFKKESKP